MRFVVRLAIGLVVTGAGFLAVEGSRFQPAHAQQVPALCPQFVPYDGFPPLTHSNYKWFWPGSQNPSGQGWSVHAGYPGYYDWSSSELAAMALYKAAPNGTVLVSGVFLTFSPSGKYYMEWVEPRVKVACHSIPYTGEWEFRVLATSGATNRVEIPNDDCDDPEMGGCGNPEGGGGEPQGEYGDSRGGMNGGDPPDWKCDIYYEYETLSDGTVIIRYWRVLQCYPSY